MKKLIERDKKLRYKIKKTEKQNYILKSIFKNGNFFLIRNYGYSKKEKRCIVQTKN